MKNIVGNVKTNRLHEMAVVAPGGARGRKRGIEAEETCETAGALAQDCAVYHP